MSCTPDAERVQKPIPRLSRGMQKVAEHDQAFTSVRVDQYSETLKVRDRGPARKGDARATKHVVLPEMRIRNQ